MVTGNCLGLYDFTPLIAVVTWLIGDGAHLVVFQLYRTQESVSKDPHTSWELVRIGASLYLVMSPKHQMGSNLLMPVKFAGELFLIPRVSSFLLVLRFQMGQFPNCLVCLSQRRGIGGSLMDSNVTPKLRYECGRENGSMLQISKAHIL